MRTQIKKITLEPKMFALLVKSPAGTILHIGAHFTLEEAYSAASNKIKTLVTYKEGDMVDIDLWNSVTAKEAISMLMDPVQISEVFKSESTGELSASEIDDLPLIIQEILRQTTPISAKTAINRLSKDKKEDNTKPVLTDYVQHAKDAKNDLMKKLIEDGNINAVEKVSSLLGATSRKYVIKEIEKKNTESNNK